ncbi:acyltransferase family protein [Clostridium lacusfryxellense]|nr:acyltransferase family protein [Clostridium lacusfryxellense]
MLAYRLEWFSTFSKSQGEKWLILGIILLFLTFIGKGKFDFILANGGLNWESFVWSFWDCLMCMALNIGLIVYFRESLNITSSFIKVLSQNTFGVYIFHVPVIAIMQFELASINLPIGIKFVIELILDIVLSFTISYLVRCLYYSNRYFNRLLVKKRTVDVDVDVDVELSV